MSATSEASRIGRLAASGLAGAAQSPSWSGVLFRQGPMRKLQHPLPAGTLVEGRYGQVTWYPGRVDNYNDDGTYDILYEDGDRSPRLSEERVRLRQSAPQSLTLSLSGSGTVVAALIPDLKRANDSSHGARPPPPDLFVSSPQSLHPGRWTHVALVAGHGRLELWIDGVRESAATGPVFCRSPRVDVIRQRG